MIKIGENCEVFSLWKSEEYGDAWVHSKTATEAVKRQIDAHENLLIAIGMGWDLDGVIEQSRAALAPFTNTDATLVDSGLRSCATPENEETGT